MNRNKTSGRIENIYDDIIEMPHYVSKTRVKMSMEERAAQFAPFAALSEYGDAVYETERTTEDTE